MPEEEGPDPVGEMVGAFGDIAGAGARVGRRAIESYQPRWPWDTWLYTDMWPDIATNLYDLVAGRYPYGPLPELEWLDKEKQVERSDDYALKVCRECNNKYPEKQ